MYEKTTNGILVRVVPEYLTEESDIARGVYFWAYHITIENQGRRSVRLRRRHWRIVDEYGHCRTVDGEGVVGECPLLDPGVRFQYTSSVSLPTPSGEMSGAYSMTVEVAGAAAGAAEKPDGEALRIDIPLFLLESPHTSRTIH